MRKDFLLGGFLAVTGQVFAAGPSADLLQHARQWLAEQRGVPAKSIKLAELDSRLQVPACNGPEGWQFDFAFSSKDTIRARCSGPTAQFFIRTVNHGGGSVQPSAAERPVSPSARETRRAVVLRQGLLRGTRLTAEHLESVELPAGSLPMQSIDNINNAIDAELTRDVLAGKPLKSTDLRPALMVKRGHTVTMNIRQAGGFSVAAQLEALQDGRKGETIRLKDRESGRILTGTGVGLNAVDGP